MKTNNRYVTMIATVVALGGFLFGFDAAVISGVIGFIRPEFDLNEIQIGWVVSSLTLTSTIAMAVVGPLSDRFGRKGLLILVGLFYAISALGSALAPSYEVLVIARMLGGFAVGAALILAPMYIAEVAPAEKRGQMVSINQLNIVLGFSAAYFANYYLLQASGSDASWVKDLAIDSETWRWMLGLEAIPAIIFFLAMIFVPESPRWLMMKNRGEEAQKVLTKINGAEGAQVAINNIQKGIEEDAKKEEVSLFELFKPAMKLVLTIGLIVGILQQITGINAIFFYATSIFEQSGIGQDASFAQAVWLGIVNVVFTIIAMVYIDRWGRKPLLLIGLAGIVLSMFLTAYGFSQATYTLTETSITSLDFDQSLVSDMIGTTYDDDVTFKNALKERLESVTYGKLEGDLIQSSITMNPILVLLGILGFVASFAISLGPVMWVLFSELFPNRLRGLAISFVGFINSGVSFLVQLFFPWSIANLGNATSYAIFGICAIIGFILIIRMLPETKGKSLEEIEKELVG